MLHRLCLLSTLLFTALWLAACPAPEPAPVEITAVAESFGNDTDTPEAQAAIDTEERTAVVTAVEQPEYGAYLTDLDGRPLYLFFPDKNSGGSTCVDECVDKWPPLLVADADAITVADGLDETLLATYERDDGSEQVTYNDWPLYHFAPDQGAETPQGHGMTDFGDEWYLVTPDGDPMDNEAVEVE